MWFRPKRFESDRLYERLGALVIKRYVPTGGDLVMRRLRRNHPKRRWVTSSLQSLWQYERRTRLNEFIHVIAFVGFTVLLPVLGSRSCRMRECLCLVT
jgi:hypothetical protein